MHEPMRSVQGLRQRQPQPSPAELATSAAGLKVQKSRFMAALKEELIQQPAAGPTSYAEILEVRCIFSARSKGVHNIPMIWRPLLCCEGALRWLVV